MPETRSGEGRRSSTAVGNALIVSPLLGLAPGAPAVEADGTARHPLPRSPAFTRGRTVPGCQGRQGGAGLAQAEECFEVGWGHGESPRPRRTATRLE
jgi:hypothetical protein